MDFHSLSRRELQALCKKNKIPANMTNIAMADALGTLQTVEGLDGIQEFLSPNKESTMSPDLPLTGRRTSVRRRTVQDEMASGDKPVSTAPRTRRGAARASAIKKMELVFEDGGKQDDHVEILDSPAAQGSPLPRSRRVTARASESMKSTIEDGDGEKKESQEKVLLETPAAGTGRRTRAAARGVCKKEDGEKEEEMKTSRYRTRLSSRKQMGEVTLEEVSTRPRTRSTGVSAAVKMVAFEQEEEKQEMEVQHGENDSKVVEEMVTENPIEAEKIDDETKLPNQQSSENREERGDHQDKGEESPIRGLVITKHHDQENLAEINEPIKLSQGEAAISIEEDDQKSNQQTEEKEEFNLPDSQVSDEVTEGIKDDREQLSENQDLAPEIPAIIGENLGSSFTAEKEEEDLDLNARLAGITLDESKHSDEDLQVEEATAIKTSPNDQTRHEIQNKIETLDVESPPGVRDDTVEDLSFCEIRSSAIETILSPAPSPLLHETTTTTISPAPSCESRRTEAPSLSDIYRKESENEEARGLTSLTAGDQEVDVRAEKQNQLNKDLHELSLRKLRTLVKESIIKKNYDSKVEGKRSALAELNENQL